MLDPFYQKAYFPRGGSRTDATYKMEGFVIIVKLTIISKCSFLDVAAALDRPLLPKKVSL